MKKIYLAVIAVFALGSSQAQQTEDFESFSLNAESFDNGQSAGGQFAIGSLILDNSYTVDTVWGDYWAGFAMSNVTDNTTPGWGNQYASFTGSGYGGSDNYSVYYWYGEMSVDNDYKAIDSFKVTNTAYAALAMRDGDFFSKVFGSIYDANGQIDGTNGEDYFRIWVYGSDYDYSNTDSIEVYLADFRFQDSTQDYILDDWINVDVSAMGFPVAHVNFAFESSDTSGGFINTPLYFAMDNMHWSNLLSLDEMNTKEVMAYPVPMKEHLFFKNYIGEVQLVDAVGRVVLTGQSDKGLDVSGIPSGSYLVRPSDHSSPGIRILK